MKFVVTGGAGFIGSNIIKLLLKDNHEVVVIDNLHIKSNRLEAMNSKIDFNQINILDFDKVESIVKNCDGVFHQAALTSLPESLRIPKEYHKVNVEGTENIFRLAEKYKFKVVFASSSSVYGEVEKIPINEDFKKNPLNPYAQTTLEDEKLAEKYSKQRAKIIGFRYFNVFGKGQTGSYAGVITKFIEKIKHKEQPEIFGTGEQIRDFVFVEDVANANLLSMKNEIEFGFFNVGTGNSYSILEIANMIINAAKLKIEPKCLEPLPGDALLSQANIDLIKKSLKWEPKMDLKMWLEIEIPKILQTSS